MSDQGQRTEQPTEQRLKKARQDGRFPASKEMLAAVQFAVFASLASGLADLWWPALRNTVRQYLALAFHLSPTRESVSTLFESTLAPFGFSILAGASLMTAATLLTQLAATGFGLATTRLTPDISRLNPMSQLRELPRRNFGSLQEAVLMLPVMLFLSWAVVASKIQDFLRLPLSNVEIGAGTVARTLSELLWKAAGVFLVWGAVDLFRQRRRYMKDLRMTKQEIREEFKQNEGSPEVKMKIRRMRRELLRRRMMAEVPTATAVIVNPTHFAVALKYDMQAMAAPRVVAKGKNYLALRIREKAIHHQVPIIENPPLAQALYKNVEVGQEIPAQLYRAVAEVLAYVFSLMKGRRHDA